MNDRSLFPDLKLFKKEITERFLLVTRDIYLKHPVYTFNDEDLITKLMIFPSYGDIESPGKQPKFVIKTGGYELSFNDTINQNMSGVQTNENGAMVGYNYFKVMNTTVTILVQAYAEEEASDLADELANLITFACRRMYSGAGIIIQGASVSDTNEANRDQGTYQTVVTIPVQAYWNGIFEGTDPPIDEVTPGTELPETPVPDGYRAPGLATWKQSLK